MQMTQQYIVYASAAPVDLIAILSRELDFSGKYILESKPILNTYKTKSSEAMQKIIYT